MFRLYIRVKLCNPRAMVLFWFLFSFFISQHILFPEGKPWARCLFLMLSILPSGNTPEGSFGKRRCECYVAELLWSSFKISRQKKMQKQLSICPFVVSMHPFFCNTTVVVVYLNISSVTVKIRHPPNNLWAKSALFHLVIIFRVVQSKLYNRVPPYWSYWI